jgi:hypothetical protein
MGGHRIDLRNITAPVVVFASWGDNITPPPQALNWIIDTWGDERAIAAAGRVIVYVLHETVGHLGIFVGADVAKKEHDQIVNSQDVIEHLPPGLYEMKVRLKDGAEPSSWDHLEPGTYSMAFEHRTMDDLRALNPEGRGEEQLFSTVAKYSELCSAAYKTWVRPWLRPLASRQGSDATLPMHELRRQRQSLTDEHPAAPGITAWAAHVRADRHALDEDHPALQAERAVSTLIEQGLDHYRDKRDQAAVLYARLAFGPLGVGAWLPPDAPAEQRAMSRAQQEIDVAREDVLAHIADGGYAQAVCRIVLAAMAGKGGFERRSLRLARRLAELAPPVGADTRSVVEWRDLARAEARIAAVAPDEALAALGRMLPGQAERERALAVATAILMVDPTLNDPASEVIDRLTRLLRVKPQRVIDLALQLSASVGREVPLAKKATTKRRAGRRA